MSQKPNGSFRTFIFASTFALSACTALLLLSLNVNNLIMIEIKKIDLIDILSASIQFYERTGLKAKSLHAQEILYQVQSMDNDRETLLQIDEMPF